MTQPFGPVPSAAEFYETAAGEFAKQRAAAQQQLAAETVAPPPEPVEIPDTKVDLFGSDKDKAPTYRESLPELLANKDKTDDNGRKLGDMLVTVTDPAGQRRGVAVRDLEQALREGFQVETAQATTIRRMGAEGALQAAAYSFVDEATLGAAGAYLRHTESPERMAQLEALKNEHELASAAGAGLGFAASLVVPGGAVSKAGESAAKAVASRLVAEGASAALSKSLARRIVENAAVKGAQFGTEAALFAAPEAVTEAALGEPEEAAEHLLWNIGAGAALGFASGAASELMHRATKGLIVAPKSKGAASVAEKATEYANEQAVKGYNLLGKSADKIAGMRGGEQFAGEVIREKGLYRRVGESFDELVGRIKTEREKVGAVIGETRDALTAKGATFDANEIANKLRADVLAPLESKVGFKTEAGRVSGLIDEVVEKHAGGAMTPDALFKMRSDLGKKIYKESRLPDSISQELRDVVGTLERVFDDAVKGHLGEAAFQKFDRANREYGLLSELHKAATKNIGRDIRNRTNSLTDYLLGTAGSAVGGPLGTLVGMFGNKYLRENGNTLLMKGAEKVSILFGEQALKRSAGELDRIPEVLDRLASGTKAVAEIAGPRAVQELTGADTTDRAGRYEAAADRLAQAQANMTKVAEEIGKVARGLEEGGAPELAAAYTQKQMAALRYLYETMPKTRGVPDMFGPRGRGAPSDREIAAWERRAEVVENPFVVVTHLEQGTLAREHVEALQAVYPRLHGKISARIAERAADPSAPVLPHHARAKLRLLLDGRPKDIASYQAAFAPVRPETAPRVSGPVGSGPSLETETQRVAGR